MGTALVTGATSGIGEEFCWQLAAAGHDLVLVARREDALRALAASLTNVAGVNAEYIAADLSTEDGCARVAARLDVGGPADAQKPDLRPVDLLVNNAGFGLGSPFLDNSLEREINGLNVMVRAVMTLAHHAGISMRSRGRGAILNVGSVASRTGAGTYSAHKAWVVAFTEGLAAELKGSGITRRPSCAPAPSTRPSSSGLASTCARPPPGSWPAPTRSSRQPSTPCAWAASRSPRLFPTRSPWVP